MEVERSHLSELRQAVTADLAAVKAKEDRWVDRDSHAVCPDGGAGHLLGGMWCPSVDGVTVGGFPGGWQRQSAGFRRPLQSTPEKSLLLTPCRSCSELDHTVMRGS